MHNFDVVILGGGPAGTAAGLTLLKRDGIKVAVIEQSAYRKPRIGESLSPGVRPLLEYLELWPAFNRSQSLEAYGSQACWGSETVGSLDYLFTLHGAGWSLNRMVFDRLLADEFAQRGGHLLTKTRFRSATEQRDSSWSIKLQGTNGIPFDIRAKYIIDTTGRRGLFVRQQGVLRTKYDQLVGIGVFARRSPGATISQSILVEACEYGWWYSSPLPDQMMATVLMTDADLAKELGASRKGNWFGLLEQMPQTRQRTQGSTWLGTPRSFLAFSAQLHQAGGQNWVAAGDSLASHDPLSSSGIPHAIGSGVQAARVAANQMFSDGRMLAAYQDAARQDYRQYLQTRRQYYRKENRWPQSIFWQRRNTRLDLDPHTLIPAKPGRRPATAHLTFGQAEALWHNYTSGEAAHEVVKRFSVLHPELPDEQIILALQDMLGVAA